MNDVTPIGCDHPVARYATALGVALEEYLCSTCWPTCAATPAAAMGTGTGTCTVGCGRRRRPTEITAKPGYSTVPPGTVDHPGYSTLLHGTPATACTVAQHGSKRLHARARTYARSHATTVPTLETKKSLAWRCEWCVRQGSIEARDALCVRQGD